MRLTPAILIVPILALAGGCAGDQAGGGGSDAAAPDDEIDAGGADAAPEEPPLGEPFWSSEMTADAADFYVRVQPEGSVELGVADPAAGDGNVARLVFPGIPELGSGDRVSPAYASELATERGDFHHGVYRMRVKLASCQPGEEAVNGLFTYFNDGTDHDADGVVDNSEIDIEVLCGTPNVLFLTAWTDYTFETETFRKWTRALDLDTGDVWQSPAPDLYGLDLAGNDPTLRLPSLLDPDAFLEIGFEWRADRVRWFATIDGEERTIAELTDASLVPELPGRLMFNVWHPGEHWFGGGGPPDYPAGDATLLVDRAAYWK
jgi:hypothetical protein